MNYHDIKHDDMNNGSGLRVTLFVSGCNHCCEGCHNPETWESESGIPFNKEAKNEIFDSLKQDYISGLTISGGDPLHAENIAAVYDLCREIKEKFPTKNIWLYTGFQWEEIMKNVLFSYEELCRQNIVKLCDIVVDGKFELEKADVNFHWAGSTNQRVIDVKASLDIGKTVLFDNKEEFYIADE